MSAQAEGWTIKDLKTLRDALRANPKFKEDEVQAIIDSLITIAGR